MRPSRIGVLVGLFVAVGAVAWGALQIGVNRGTTPPPLTWTAPTGVAALAVVVLVTALGLRSRLEQPEKRPHPLSMARMAVLGKASAHVGPIVGGLYAGYLLVLLPHLEIDARQDRAILCIVAVVGAAVLTVAGLLLEWSCRVPPSDTDDQIPSARA